MRDVITSSDIRPSWPDSPIQAPLNPPVHELKGVTPLVKPGQTSGCSCGISSIPKETVEKKDTEHLSKAKDEIIAEVVRRVMGQFN